MTIDEICTAILYVPHVELDESAAQKLIEAIKSRIEVSNFRHCEHATGAIESLEDAATILWNAADDIRKEKSLLEPELDGFRTIPASTLDQVVSV